MRLLKEAIQESSWSGRNFDIVKKIFKDADEKLNFSRNLFLSSLPKKYLVKKINGENINNIKFNKSYTINISF